MDWQEVGYKVGVNNESPQEEFQRYSRLCTEEHGIVLPKEKFSGGFSKGVEKFCQSVDYGAMGQQGLTFQYPDRCDPHQEKIAKERHQYGLLAFCTYDSGYSKGLAGDHYQNVCDTKSEPQFLKGYNLGVQKRTLSKIEKLSNQVQSLKSELRDRDDQIQQLNSRIQDLEADLNEKDRKLEALRR